MLATGYAGLATGYAAVPRSLSVGRTPDSTLALVGPPRIRQLRGRGNLPAQDGAGACEVWGPLRHTVATCYDARKDAYSTRAFGPPRPCSPTARTRLPSLCKHKHGACSQVSGAQLWASSSDCVQGVHGAGAG